MARMFKVLPEMDDDFQRPLGFTMVLLFISMCMSMFDYRSLLRTVLIIYGVYICLTFKQSIYAYIRKQIKTFRPVMAPYQSGSDVGDDDDDDEGYDEDDDKDLDNDGTEDDDGESKGDEDETKGGYKLRQRTLRTSTL